MKQLLGVLLSQTKLIVCLQVFELDCHGAVNCCTFISDTCLACGTQDGHITVTDVRNIRSV